MYRLLSRVGAYALTSAFCLITVGRLSAQTTAAPAAAKPADDETIVLSPFIVDASEDTGYAAKDTLAGTRVRTELKDVASSISVVTQQFLKDTGANNNADLLVYTPSTEVAGIRGNFTGVAGAPIAQENTVSTSTRVRGLDSADNTRDYFLTDIPWDGFNVGRVDLQRGPNSILFGTGSPAGIINTSVNDAAFKNIYTFQNRVDQWGSMRNRIDLNQQLIPGVLAIRVAALKDDELYEQKPAFNNDTRFYGAIRFDPKLFGKDSHTSIRAKYENGKIDSNNPRQLPPNDTITPWFKTGVDAYGNPGYNKLTINQFSLTNPNASGVPLPGLKGGALANATYSLGSNQGRSYWPDIINYYEGIPKSENNVANPQQPNGTPLYTITAQPNTAFGLSNGSIGGVLPGFLPMAIPLYSQYVFNIQNPDNGYRVPSYPGGKIPGGAYYADVAMTDPSVFNFYKQLLDGPNKKEWQKWNAFNLAIEQTFFNERLAFLLAADHQVYTSGTEGWMQGQQYAINIDVNQTYADGSANPNVGRPLAASASSAPGQNQYSTTTRDSLRFTPVVDIRASDYLGNSEFAKILGKHVFTGLYERNNIVKNNVNFAQFGTTPQYEFDNSPNPNAANTLNSNRSFEWVVYLGPSMLNRSSAAGLNLHNITNIIEPPTNQTVRNFNSHWNKPTNPSDPNYVNPTAAYNYTNYQNGTITAGHQSDNPANYVGWQQEPVQWLRASNPADFTSLINSASRNRYRDISKGITWQGYFLDGDLVPTFGWRKDTITTYESQAITDANSGFTSLNYPDNLNSRQDQSGISKTWGAVYHLPKSLTSKLPGETQISFFYNRGENFKADPTRLSLMGTPIPNANGHTKEYGITINTLNDKLTLKIAKFKTKVQNATLSDTSGNSIGGLGANGYFLADGVIWGYAWATSLQDGLRGQTPGTSYWDYSQADAWSNPAIGASGSPTYIANNQKNVAIVNAWLALPLPQQYFRSFALSPDLDPTIGSKTGNLRDSYTSGYNDVNGPNPGGGSSFGNHQTTVDNLSSGTELELTYTPTKNWNLTLNYSKVKATHENIDPVSSAFIGTMTAFMNGPGGQVREWFNGGNTLGAQWNASIVAPYTVELNQLGHAAPEVSPWRFNMISTYTFDHGPLKDVSIGGAYRLEAGRIIGYHYDPTFQNANSSDPNYAKVTLVTQGGLNVNQPFIGQNEHHIDAWVRYSKKVTHDVNWSIQLNIRSVGEKDRIMAARINPDGNIALARIVQGMGWSLTNTFEF